MTEAALHCADVVALEQQLTETLDTLRIYRESLFVTLTLLHGAALRLLDQDTQLRALLDAR